MSSSPEYVDARYYYPFIESHCGEPHDALDQAAAALDAITTLIAGNKDLHLMGAREIDGLVLVFRAVVNVMDVASAAYSSAYIRGLEVGKGLQDREYRRGFEEGRRAGRKEAGNDAAAQ